MAACINTGGNPHSTLLIFIDGEYAVYIYGTIWWVHSNECRFFFCMSCIHIIFPQAKCVYHTFYLLDSIGCSWKRKCMITLSPLSLVCDQDWLVWALQLIRSNFSVQAAEKNLNFFLDIKFSSSLILDVFILPPHSNLMQWYWYYSRALDMLLFCQRRQVVLECLYRWEDWLKRFPHLRQA